MVTEPPRSPQAPQAPLPPLPPLARRPQSVTVSWSVGGLLLVVALALTIVDLARVPQTRPTQRAPISLGTQALSAAAIAARTEAINFFTLDPTNIDQQISTILKLSTAPFTAQYQAKAAQVKKGVVDGKLTSSATVADDSTAVEYNTAATVVVIVAVDTTTKTTSGTTQTDRYRMRLTAKNVNGTWLVSSIEQVN